MNGQHREKITPGMAAMVVLKKDQRSGKLTQGAL
jgi:uncharacterized repeat protein (TIGR03833 family)